MEIKKKYPVFKDIQIITSIEKNKHVSSPG
jgi:hypothetical protein